MGSIAAAASAPASDVVRADPRQLKKTAPEPRELLAVEERSGTIHVADTQLPIISQLSRHAFVSDRQQHGLVLGFSSAEGAKSMVDTAIGKVTFTRFLAAARKKLWWMTPEWGTEPGDLPPETQFLLLELKDGGPYAILLPLIDSDTFRATLRPPSSADPEKLLLRMESGDDSVLGERWQSGLYVAAGNDPFELVDSAVAAAAAISGDAKPRVEKHLPPTLDVFGWCTWDAFYSRVSAQGLHQGLESLVEGGVPPRFLIIDDGWQNTDVDKRFRTPPTSRSMPKNKQMQDASDEYFGAEIEVLADAKKDIPPSSSAGLALKQLTDNEGRPYHANIRHNKRREKGRWLAETVKETMTSISMNEDLYDSDDDTPPPSALRKRNRASMDGSGDGVASSTVDASGDAPVPGKKPAMEQLVRSGTRAPTGTLAADEERADLAESSGVGVQRQPIRWPGQRVVGPVIGLIVAIFQRLAGLSMGLLEVGLLKFYQWVVDTAPPESWSVRTFTYLATGPFREMLLEFYAASGDFTRRLTSIKANSKFSSPAAGPDDLYSGEEEDFKSVITSLRATYGVDYIYCWHGLPAYWSGISVEDPGTSVYGPELVFAKGTDGLYEIEPSMRWNPAVVAGVGMAPDPFPLYRDMHSYLASAGVSGVKVDCQAGIGLMGSKRGGGPAVAAAFHGALEDSIRTHFPGNHAINCMAHSTENIYRWRDTAVARASDDFYPRDPASSTPHISACAFLSLFLSPLVQPDWDMFHSKHPAAVLHAAARVLSGGSIYVSDYPGQHDFELLRRLVLPDGSILRAQLPGRPTRDSLFRDPLRDAKSLLKVWNTNKHSGLVGVFHLQGAAWSRRKRQFLIHDATPPPLSTSVRVADVEPLLAAGSPADKWVAYDDATQRMELLGREDTLPVWVEAGRSTIVTMAAVQRSGRVNVAAVGLTNMMNAGGAIKDFQLSGDSSRNGDSSDASASVQVKGHGSLLLYADAAPKCITVDGGGVQHSYDAASGNLTITLPDSSKLDHDVHVQF
jgi:raffinose synthase